MEATKQGFIDFIDANAKRGNIKGNTAVGIKVAASKLLEQFGDQDSIADLDYESLIRQYANRHPNLLSPASLKVYESRLRNSVEAYERSVEDPTKNPWGTKPPRDDPTKDGVKREKKLNNEGVKKLKSKDLTKEPESLSGSIRTNTSHGTEFTAKLTVPYPLRHDFIAQVVIPVGMTPVEADNLANFIKALAPHPR
jgi:hypothetical protein